MPKYAALLRGINVGGKNIISMADLRKWLEGEGFTNVATLLQSGNVVFDAESADVEEDVAKAIERESGFKIEVCVRSHSELLQVVKETPFKSAAEEDPGHLLVIFLKTAPTRDREEALRSAIKGSEQVVLRGRELYAYYPDGIGRSKLTNAVIDKQLGTVGTGRNWNTVLKLMEMLRS